MWPAKKQGIWDLPLQQIPFPGHSFEVLSMDYNILANQSQNSTKAPPANYPGWRQQATDAYIAGFQRAYETNRAPLFIGNHFEQWNGGIYMDAVEEALKHMAEEKPRTCGWCPSGSSPTGWTPGPGGARQAAHARGRAGARPAAGSDLLRRRLTARASWRRQGTMRPRPRGGCAKIRRMGHAKLFT